MSEDFESNRVERTAEPRALINMRYVPESTMRSSRAEYFSHARFPADGGYSDKWVKLKIGPATVAFPNSAARVRFVKLHDLHHVFTEYETDWTGEAEIAAWEIASAWGNGGQAFSFHFLYVK